MDGEKEHVVTWQLDRPKGMSLDSLAQPFLLVLQRTKSTSDPLLNSIRLCPDVKDVARVE